MIYIRYGYNCNEHLVHYVTHVTAIFVQILCPPDYRSWLQTMYCHFGQKWSKLHHGPLCSVKVSVQSPEGTEHNSHSRDTMQVS